MKSKIKRVPIQINILTNDENKMGSTININLPLGKIFSKTYKPTIKKINLIPIEINSRPSLGLPETSLMSSINF